MTSEEDLLEGNIVISNHQTKVEVRGVQVGFQKLMNH